MFKIRPKTIFYYACCILFFPFTLLFFWRNKIVNVTKYTVLDDKIPSNFNGFKILQLSDFHNNALLDLSAVDRAIEIEKPNIITLTGDLLDANRLNVQPLVKLLNVLKKSGIPIYFSMGNHEAKNGYYTEELKLLKEYNVVVLQDEETTLSRGEDKITLAGLQEYTLLRKYPTKEEIESRVERSFQKIPVNGYTVLLSHRPELFSFYVQKGYSLVLTGHAHGGQWRLPCGIYSPSQGLFPKYSCGLYTQKNTTMVVHRGMGNSSFPFRIHNDPEIVFIELKKS